MGSNELNGQTDNAASYKIKAGLAQMLKGGVIMDVVNPEQAKIAEEAGACAVMALERVPADIRKDGGVARMSDPEMIKEIIETVSIPVMAKARIGEATGIVTDTVHQLFGAMGFTHEHVLHHYTRRLWDWREEYGNERYWQETLGSSICAGGADQLWPFLATRR